MSSKQFKLQLIQKSLAELGYGNLAEQISEDIHFNPITHEAESPYHNDQNEYSDLLKFIEWFYEELNVGNYATIIEYLNYIMLPEESAMNVDDIPQDFNNIGIDLFKALNLKEDSVDTIGGVCTLIITYLIKRTYFLECLVVNAFNSSKQYHKAELVGDISRYSFTPISVPDLLVILRDDLCPLLDEIQNALKSININEIVGSMWNFKPDLVELLNREKESTLLLPLVMKSPIELADLTKMILNDQVLLADTTINQISLSHIIDELRNILIDKHLCTIFKDSCRNPATNKAAFDIPPDYLDKLIENATAYQKEQSPYYLPPRINSKKQGEAFLPPLYSEINEKYKKSFPSTLITTLDKHSDEVWIAKFSPLGKLLVTGSLDGRLIIYDVLNNFEVIAILDSDIQGIKSRTRSNKAIIYCCWEPNEEYLVSCCLDTVVRVWSIKDIKKNNKRITRSMDVELDSQVALLRSSFTLGESIKTWSCEFLPTTADPQFIIGSPDKVLKAFNIDGKELFDFYADTEENGLYHDEKASSSDIKDGNDKTDSTNDGENKDKTNNIQNNFYRVNDLAITPDGKFLITANDDKQVYFYTIPDLLDPNSTTTKIATVSLGGKLTSCSISSNGKYLLLSITPEEVQIWDISGLGKSEKPILRKKLIGHSQDKYIVRSSFGYLSDKQEELAISGSVDGYIYIWKIETGQLITRIKGHVGLCNSVDWNKYYIPKKNCKDYGKLWCSVGDDKIVKIWGPSDWSNE